MHLRLEDFPRQEGHTPVCQPLRVHGPVDAFPALLARLPLRRLRLFEVPSGPSWLPVEDNACGELVDAVAATSTDVRVGVHGAVGEHQLGEVPLDRSLAELQPVADLGLDEALGVLPKKGQNGLRNRGDLRIVE